MILADKIIELRKKSGMTQDELAEKLGVSRQSVSKWEGAQSTPDLARILKLAEIFSVSTDVLLKDELELEQNISTENIETVSVKAHVETEPPLRPVSMAEAVEYLEKNSKKALYVAAGVALCILSPVAAILFEILFEDSALSEASRYVFFACLYLSVISSRAEIFLTRSSSADLRFSACSFSRASFSIFAPEFSRAFCSDFIFSISATISFCAFT